MRPSYIAVILVLLFACNGTPTVTTSRADGAAAEKCVSSSSASIKALNDELGKRLGGSTDYGETLDFLNSNLDALEAFAASVTQPLAGVIAGHAVTGSNVPADSFYAIPQRSELRVNDLFHLVVETQPFDPPYQEISFGTTTQTWTLRSGDIERRYAKYTFRLAFASLDYTSYPGAPEFKYSLTATTATGLLSASAEPPSYESVTVTTKAVLAGKAFCDPASVFWPSIVPFPAYEMSISRLAGAFPGVTARQPGMFPTGLLLPKK